jgi:branched-chain amino acid transport system permease protein
MSSHPSVAVQNPTQSAPSARNVRFEVLIPGAVIWLVVAIFPLIVRDLYYIQLVTEIMIVALLAMSLNFLIGYTGLVSLGHATFLGLGAYACAIITKEVYESIWLGLVCAGVLSAVVAAFIGIFCVRLSGLYFAMITMAFSQAFYTVAFYWTGVTGGDDGMIGIPRPAVGIPGLPYFAMDSFEGFYYLTLGIVTVLMLIAWRIVGSPFGSVLQAIRDNPERVEFLGLPVQRYKLAAFVISGVFGGLAGGLFATYQGFISPELLYWTKSGEIVLMTILGGMYSFLGPTVGAGIFLFLRDTVLNYTEYWKIIVGGVLILLVLFMPGGVVGYLTDRTRALWER